MIYRFAVSLCLLLSMSIARADDEARAIIQAAIDNFRGVSSYTVTEMTIHRPDWERTMRMQVWTEGAERSLVRVVGPKKDAGNGNLLMGDQMWSFTPKINRVIKIPSSMMNQSWMGSDFSNNDVARSDDLVDQYDHKLVANETMDGHKVYTIESVPHESAPVVWGKELLKVRDDFVLLEHALYDQDGALVKKLVTKKIADMGGKTIAAVQRMEKVDAPEEWTELRVIEAEFGIDIPANTFTLSNLRNPRR